MKKWFEEEVCDNSIVISSRVRLARNLKKYPFPRKLSEINSEKMITEVRDALMNDRTPLANEFRFVDMKGLNAIEKKCMMESHGISPVLFSKKENCGVLIKNDETVSIMLNEEDHIRIQTVFAGEEIDKAWDMADKLDNLIEESVEYAFDEEVGYITACPTNMGTGLRASFMVHIPSIEKSGQLRNLVNALGKFSITVRGIYGEGTEAMGAIYQISNQLTLGQSEEEIIKNLKIAMNFVKEQEIKIRKGLLSQNKLEIEDECYRAYGIITNARKITAAEAFDYLSKIREGYITGVLDLPKPDKTIYEIIIHIQPGNMQKTLTAENVDKRDEERANYLRKVFTEK